MQQDPTNDAQRLNTDADRLHTLCMAAAELIDDLTNPAQQIEAAFNLAYRLGYTAGHDVGYQAAHHEMETAWAKLARQVHATADTPLHDDLEHRRWDGPRHRFADPRPGDHPGGPVQWETPPAEGPTPADPWATLPHPGAAA